MSLKRKGKNQRNQKLIAFYECLYHPGFLHRDEEWPYSRDRVYNGGAAQLGHADYC